MIPLEKKTNITECQDYRTISLISHASKIILKILTKRIEAKATAVNWITNEQFGFRKGVGTRDAIGVLRTLGARSLQHNKDLYICFIHYEKAFDRVNWYKLTRALVKLGVYWRDRRLIYRLYKNQSVVIRINGLHPDACQLGRGVRQGCPLYPLLFNTYIQQLIEEALENREDGLKVTDYW